VEQLQAQGKEVSQFFLDGVKRYKDKADRAEEFIKAHNLQKPEEIMDAAIRFCLDNENVNTVCCLAKTYQEMESFVRLSGTRLSDKDTANLRVYKEGCGELYCRHACGLCEPACPHHVPVNTIMRYHQYFAAQRREREAMELYAEIAGHNAEVCRECPGYCEAACPYHVSIQGMLLVAHADLSMP
jgi:predicted aldo/keto reductase-like oxidoreductase